MSAQHSHEKRHDAFDVNKPTGIEVELQTTPYGDNLSSKSKQEEVHMSGFKLRILLAALTLVSFLLLLDTSILSTATPRITSHFHSLSDVGWYGAAYQLSSATLQPLTGKIYSNFSTKWTYLTFFLVFELGSLLCGVSTSSNMLIVARAVAGMGSSGLMNGAMTIIAGCAPMPKRPALFGMMMGVGQLGLVGGPMIGGLLTEYVSWRWCFYINLPLGGIVAAILVLIHIPENIPKAPPRAVLRELHHKLDLFGFVLFAPWTIMLLLAVQWGGNQYAWDSAIVIGLLCGAAGMASVWIYWNWRQKDNAMLPWPMLKRQHVWTSCLTMAFLSAGIFITSYYLPIWYFQGVRGHGPAISGVYLLPGIISQLLGAVASGKLVGVLGYYLPWSIASGVLSAVGYGLLSTLAPTTSTGEWIGYQILAGAGRGVGLQMPIIAIQNTLELAQIPTAMSLIIFSQTMGGALFLSFADTILTNRLRALLPADVDAHTVISAGAYDLRSSLSETSLLAVLRAYARSIDAVFYLCAGLATACVALAFGMGWVDIRGKKQSNKAQEEC